MTPASTPGDLLASQMLEHLPTRLRTLATFFGANRHRFVIRELFASRRALIATLGAALARRSGQRAVTRRQARGQLAAIAAVNAEVHALRVLLFAIGHQRRTMMEAHVALDLALRAGFGALHEVISVRVFGRLDAHGNHTRTNK